ncbi:MAG: hypothetical protein K2M43_02315 [Mycoplasmoidaceae bacterium]|nr:hypothetical protein [Mycoplasmoidaceae bacterium]
MIRPEDIIVCKPSKDVMNAKVLYSIYKGEIFEAKCQFKKHQFILKTTSPVKTGDLIGLKFAENTLHLIPLDKKSDNEFFNINFDEDE